MIFDDTTYEEELIEKGRREARKTLFEMAKELVTKENWSLAEAASFARLTKTETRKLADELHLSV
jgi:hypothetical protein